MNTELIRQILSRILNESSPENNYFWDMIAEYFTEGLWNI